MHIIGNKIVDIIIHVKKTSNLKLDNLKQHLN
jgi:hypothetical protein